MVDVAYKVHGSSQEIITSTTRPETLLGDVAVLSDIFIFSPQSESVRSNRFNVFDQKEGHDNGSGDTFRGTFRAAKS